MHDISMAIFGITGLLALATLLVPLANRVNIPFSIVLASAGVLLGLVLGLSDKGFLIGPPADFITAIGNFRLSSEALILVFLPALLFETAIVIDVRRLADDIGPILLLAVVAVLVSTFIVGLGLNAFTDIGLVSCLLLAAILSTTDPVAVVAIFRDLGVPHRLSMLVEGESLFNDAAAISLFGIFISILTGEHQTSTLGGIFNFLYGFTGGLAAGFVLGQLVCWGLVFLRGQRFAQITLTVASAWLTYILSEHYLQVSGVVAVVTAALTISYKGRTRVSPETWTGMVNVWQQVGYWASALVFLLAMMRVPEMLRAMDLHYLWLLLILVVISLAARALVLFGLFPGLVALGFAEPASKALRAVIVWGGLRGAISLALALAVVEAPGVPEEVKAFVATLCTGFVLFTLIVNAPTLGPLIRLLGLNRLTPGDLAVRSRALAAALVKVRSTVSEAAAGFGFESRLIQELSDHHTQRLAQVEQDIDQHLHLTGAEEIASLLAMLAAHEESIYHRYHRNGVVRNQVLRMLIGIAARLQDEVESDGLEGYRLAHRKSLAFSLGFRLALLAQRRLGITAWLTHRIALRIEMLLVLHGALRELMGFNSGTLASMSSSQASLGVREVLEQRVKDVDTALEALRLQYGDFFQALQRLYLEKAATRAEELEYRQLRAQAIISQEVFNDLLADLQRRSAISMQQPVLDLALDAQAMIARVPLFETLDGAGLAKIARLLHPVVTLPGETVVRKGELGNAMYFIASGAVEVELPSYRVYLGSGEFFGEMALITGERRSADITSLGFCSLLMLRVEDFQALVSTSPEIQRFIKETALGRRLQ